VIIQLGDRSMGSNTIDSKTPMNLDIDRGFVMGLIHSQCVATLIN